MKTIKHLSRRLMLYGTLLALLSGVLTPGVWAEEAGESPAPSPTVVSEAPAPSPVVTTESPAPSPAPSPEPIVMTFPVAPTEPITAPENETTNNLVVPTEPAPSPAPLEIVVIQPASPSNEAKTEESTIATTESSGTPTPPATTTAPIVFDFSPVASSTPATAVCGNSKVEAGEQCDDGNVTDNDACSASCQTSSPAQTETVTVINRPEIKDTVILAQWQMLLSQDKTQNGADDSLLVGGQFLPSGQYQLDKKITVCVALADSARNVKTVSALVNYPQDFAFNKAGTSEKIGCGSLQSELELTALETKPADDLLCNQIRNNNNNLPNWSENQETKTGYDYEQICGETGILAKQGGQIYCGEISLAYNDPAGDYPVKITVNKDLANKIEAESKLQYLELTTFESDFTNIQYGSVDLDQFKLVPGDNIFGSGAPTIRNTGNTRLLLKIWQNDLHLGKTGDEWNLRYQAKLGGQTEYTQYAPEEKIVLNQPLYLGQAVNVDFGVLVKRYPAVEATQAYDGAMIISADKTPFWACQVSDPLIK